MARILIVLALLASASAAKGRAHIGAQRESSLLQTYNQALNGNVANANGVTPVTRVVNLLKEMTETLNKEMDEDEGLYKKLSCWCNDNVYAKKLSSDANKEKIDELSATIEMLTAKSKGLKEKILELETEVAADKKALSEASAVRKKQLKEFQDTELDSIAAIENLKGAIVVLSKHQDGAFPQMPVSLLALNSKDSPFGAEHETHKSFAFDEFLRKQNFHLGTEGLKKAPEASPSHFLQAQAGESSVHGLTLHDADAVKSAMRTASALLQARHGESYMPSYSAASGEIFGVLKQLKSEMEADLSEAQKTEAARAANFAELRTAKTSEIEEGEKMAETKEDEKANCDNDLAEAKEDLGQTQGALAEDEKFSGNLKKTCDEAAANFAERKKSRLAEIQAVAETIEILTGDEAKDAMDTTFSFVQASAEKSASKQLRRQAATVLRKSRSPELSMLATSVELDAFTKVKEMIDKMLVTLKAQMADEVKKNDWCKAELQENEMATMKTKDLKADLEAKSGELESTIKKLSEEIEKANLDISDLRVALQRASEDRKQENVDFQKTVADQVATAEVLNKALDKLATFYDEAAFTQMHSKATKKQTPPVPQMEYSKSKGAGGVMSMIEKLIYDTKDITAKSKKSESEAQAAYEELIADTNASVDGLTKEITSKTKAKAQAKKDLSLTQGDLADAVRELEDLGKTNADLHGDCDYVMKNFMIRQKARSEEIEALQQAKQILGGANLG